MVWNSIWPIGGESTKKNVTTGDQNTAYIETTLNNDHFWNIGVDEDGRHRFVQTVATNDADKTLPTNAPLTTGMDLAFFSRFKTPTEATFLAGQNAQPYAIGTPGAQVMQILGIRACAVWDVVAGGDPTNQNIIYSHNVSSVSRQIAGRYQINFTTPLPSDNYIPWGGGMAQTVNTAFDSLYGSIASGTAVATRKNTLNCIFMLRNQSGVLINALQGWFVCFGG